MVQIALTRAVSPSLDQCALSFLEREPIDVTLAVGQHLGYEDLLRELGLKVISLPAEPDLPDAVFVEDAAVVVDEVAVLTAPALPSRRPEVESIGRALAPYRSVRRIEGDATLDGGDVLRLGRTLYVGLSARTNRAGCEQLAAVLRPYGYEVQAAGFRGCLHLKSACTPVGPDTVLANPDWVDTDQFAGWRVVAVAPDEPHAANALRVDDSVIFPASFPHTAERLRERGCQLRLVDVSELQKAEAGVTCCSLIFTA